MKLKKFVIDNGTSSSQENIAINILKINFPSTHIHSTYNTQTYNRKLRNSKKFERIGNTEETYPRPISMSSIIWNREVCSCLLKIEKIKKIVENQRR